MFCYRKVNGQNYKIIFLNASIEVETSFLRSHSKYSLLMIESDIPLSTGSHKTVVLTGTTRSNRTGPSHDAAINSSKRGQEGITSEAKFYVGNSP